MRAIFCACTKCGTSCDKGFENSFRRWTFPALIFEGVTKSFCVSFWENATGIRTLYFWQSLDWWGKGTKSMWCILDVGLDCASLPSLCKSEGIGKKPKTTMVNKFWRTATKKSVLRKEWSPNTPRIGESPSTKIIFEAFVTGRSTLCAITENRPQKNFQDLHQLIDRSYPTT